MYYKLPCIKASTKWLLASLFPQHYSCVCMYRQRILRVGASANSHILFKMAEVRQQRCMQGNWILSHLMHLKLHFSCMSIWSCLFIELFSSVIHNITALTDSTVPSKCRWDIPPLKRWTWTRNPCAQIWCLYILFYTCTCCWHGHGVVEYI